MGVRIVYKVTDIYGLGIGFFGSGGFGADHRAEEISGYGLAILYSTYICSPTKYAAPTHGEHFITGL